MYKKKSSVQGELSAVMECYAQCVSNFYYLLFNREMVVTSIRDGKHMKGSKHYTGDAIDVRSRDLSDKDKTWFVTVIKRHFDKWLDVVVEKDHIHIEYDPH